MTFSIQKWFVAAFVLMLCVFWGSNEAFGQSTLKRISFPELNDSVEVTPGQQFYADMYVRPQKGYRLDRAFKSSMAGAAGFPFSFSIETTLLVYAGKSKDGSWSYYVPEGNKFKASHGLLGSVIRPGDSVGLRIHESGRREWYVDNSVYNGYTTIWSRKVKDKDPTLTEVEIEKDEPSGLPVYRLIYLGLDGRQARVRLETINLAETVRDEFKFELDASDKAIVYVNGGEFELAAQGAKAIITVRKHMVSDLAMPKL